MLWVNLIMDTLASLALATEPPIPELMIRKPHKRDDYIISKTMFKHIICAAIYELIILFIIAFVGETFLPEYPGADRKYFDDMSALVAKESLPALPADWAGRYFRNLTETGKVCSGRLYLISGENDYFNKWRATGYFSRHFTILFNIFIFMQVFNFMNSRKINDELNVFAGVTNNPLFFVIVAIIIVLQILIVTFFGSAFQVYGDFGLTIQQWLISVAS